MASNKSRRHEDVDPAAGGADPMNNEGVGYRDAIPSKKCTYMNIIYIYIHPFCPFKYEMLLESILQ